MRHIKLEDAILNADIEPLFIADDVVTDAKNEVYTIFVRLHFHEAGRPATRLSLTRKDFASKGTLRSAFQGAGAAWNGGDHHINTLQKDLCAPWVTRVRAIINIGYVPEYEAYVFPGFAVCLDGSILCAEKDGLFHFPDGRIAVLDDDEQGARNITPSVDKPDIKHIYDELITGWGMHGAVSLAWLVASWYRHLIKPKIQMFPYLQFYGEPGTGKSALSRVMHRMQFMDREGEPLSHINTDKGLARLLCKRSSLFYNLDEPETDTKHHIFDAMIYLYDRDQWQVKAKKTMDLATAPQFFRGTLMFTSNADPFIRREQKERCVTMYFSKAQISTVSTKAYAYLTDNTRAQQLGHFFIHMIKHHAIIEHIWYDMWLKSKQEIIPYSHEDRFTSIYGLLLTFHHIICMTLGIKPMHEFVDFLGQLIAEKMQALALQELATADIFFNSLFSYEVPDMAECVVIKRAENKVYIHMPKAVESLRKMGINMYALNTVYALHKELKKHPAFIESSKQIRPTDDMPWDKKLKVWVFKLDKLPYIND